MSVFQLPVVRSPGLAPQKWQPVGEASHLTLSCLAKVAAWRVVWYDVCRRRGQP